MRISLVYCICGFLWILFSDRVISVMTTNPEMLSWLQTWKGWFFVAATAALLFLLIDRQLKAISQATYEATNAQQRFRSIFDNTLQMTILTDNHGRVKEANRSTVQFLGIPVSEIRGRHLWQVLGWSDEITSRFKDAIRRAAAGAAVRETLHVLDAAGNDRYVDTSVRPLPGKDGHIALLLVEGKDATELRLAQERVREILELATVVLFKVDYKNSRYVYFSPGVRMLTGYDPEELLQDGFEDFKKRVHPEDLEQLRRHHTVSRQRQPGDGNDTAAEFRIKTKSGAYQWFSSRTRVIFDAEGKAVFGIGHLRDISDERRAREEGRKIQALLNEAISQTPAAMLMVDARDLRIRFANAAALKIVIEAESSRDNGERELEAKYLDQLPDILFDPLSLALHRGGITENLACAYTRPDGDQCWLACNAAPVRDDRGDTIAAVVVLSDITQSKRIALELEKYRHMADSSRDLMSLVDDRFVYQTVNESMAAFFGRTPAEMIGKKVSRVLGEEFFSRQIEPLARECLKGREVHRQQWVTSTLGKRWFAEISYYPHWDRQAKDKVSGVVSIFHDMTKTKQLEEKLRQAHKIEAIGTLAGGIAHDFNNILAAIMGYAEITRDLVPKDSTVWANIDKIYRAGQRAAQLVRQILTFSRQSEQRTVSLQMGPIIKEALKLIRASLPTSIDVVWDIRSDAMVEADPIQVHQIIMNLCANAGYAMTETGGTLAVQLENVDVDAAFVATHPGLYPGRHVRLTVSDTGTGIPREIRHRIFDPFFTTKPHGIGTGMGLSQVLGIVESCQGIVTVHSAPGEGTTFMVYLPVTEAQAASVEEEVQIPPPGGRETILFVDDEAYLVELGQRTLGKLGYRVVAVSGSREALDLFRQNPTGFDLVITDYAMPNMTGDKLAAELLRIRPDIPIILATGFGDRFTQEKIEAIGIRRLVLKPLLRKELADAIRDVMDE